MIFSEKRNIIFPDNTRKIIFHHDFFGKTIFSGRLKKKNLVFRAIFEVFIKNQKRFFTKTILLENTAFNVYKISKTQNITILDNNFFEEQTLFVGEIL